MTAPGSTTVESRQDAARQLAEGLGHVRAALRRHVARVRGEPLPAGDPTARSHPADAALDRLARRFGLSRFERDVLLLCAGVERDAEIASLCATVHGDPQCAYATFGLALAALPDADWGALSPNAPLRWWRLVEVTAGHALTGSPLRIGERVLHWLMGVDGLDERLAGLVEPVDAPAPLAPSQDETVAQIVAIFEQAPNWSAPPIVQLCGEDTGDRRAVAAAACAALGLRLYAVAADALPVDPKDIGSLIRLWQRDGTLSESALLLECDDLEGPPDAERTAAVSRFIAHSRGVLLVSGRDRRRTGLRAAAAFDVRRASPAEQRGTWRAALGSEAARLNGQVEQLTSHFDLSARAIHAAALEGLGRAPGASPTELGRAVWEACRMQARPRLDELAQRLEPGASWEQLVLPDAQRQILRDMAAHVRQRTTVYERWGFAAHGSRGLGISALFAGASGTGKTMAAEVLADELRLDLYRVDLSQVVSKYIGETEKNLRRIFDAAEQGGVILLFDEADALFGKRSDVKDSHDRYANIEVSYLLQRMESYRGLAILTSNLKSSLDVAFLRRIRFVVQFPFPDHAQRTEIWRRVFPPDMPRAGLDPAALARLNVSGGNIRNIALGAAFHAADAGEPVGMRHVLRAARSEYAKLERPLTDAELAGWE
jgi:hypothetical protein